MSTDKLSLGDQLAAAKQLKEALERLKANPDYQRLLAPVFADKLAHHSRQCRNRDMTAEKRAEHIEAAALAEELTTLLDDRIKAVEVKIKGLSSELGKKIPN